jgi:hypothetical protein
LVGVFAKCFQKQWRVRECVMEICGINRDGVNYGFSWFLLQKIFWKILSNENEEEKKMLEINKNIDYPYILIEYVL